jgi:hypothetical protein
MNLDELLARHQAKKDKTRRKRRLLRNWEYRDYFPLIRDAVANGVPLWSAIEILKADENAFEGKTTQAVWQAYARALKGESPNNTPRHSS